MASVQPNDLLVPEKGGLYCPPGDFYIDVMRPVDKAIVTHGHADHARAGHGTVLATAETLDIMAVRYGKNFTKKRQAVGYGKTVKVGPVSVTLFPAGHILGSAQVLIEMDGFRAVATGDYKRRADPTCAGFEVVPCDLFVTESTFGMPVFHHPDDIGEAEKVLKSLVLFPDYAHMIGVYSLGKAQRLIALLRAAGWDHPIYLHRTLVKLCATYQAHGVDLGRLAPIEEEDKTKTNGEIILAPPNAVHGDWGASFAPAITGFASGWLSVQTNGRGTQAHLPLIISDHADWSELTQTIRNVNPETVWIMYGDPAPLTHYAQSLGMRAGAPGLI